MTDMKTGDDLVLVCSCTHLGHVVRFSRFDGGDDDPQTLTISVTLEHAPSVWKRMLVAWRYLFGRTCAYGSASEFILTDADIPKVRAWLDRAEARK